MKKKVDIFAIKEFETMREDMTLQEAIIESNRCLLCEDAPCSIGCPAGTDPGKFIRQIKFQNYKGAARTVRKNNILGSSCAHICPTEKLCELGCSAKELTHPINISGLQQFAVSFGKHNNLEPLTASNKTAGKVAIVGAGPSSLSCASELAKLDYDVTIFEKDNKGGGVLRWNIPSFRLPETAIEHDLKNVSDLGVEIKYNTLIDAEKGKELLNNYDALFLGTGMDKAFELPELKGYDNSKNYIEYLREIKTDRQFVTDSIKGKSVAVIGGGSVALDCAVSSAALGAQKVYLISLEHLQELPGDPEEIELGHLVNIIFKPNTKVTGVKLNDGKIKAITGNEISWKEENNFSPSNAINIEDTEFTLKADFVIQAIGTKPTISNIFPELKTVGKGTIVGKDGISQQNKIFAAGDVVNGGATAVQAVGDGKKAAIAIDNFIKGGK